MKLNLVFAAVVLLAASPAAAQVVTTANYQLGYPQGTVGVATTTSSGAVTLNQSSNYNFANATQNTSNGNPSVALTQAGITNTAAITQSGASTTTALAQFGGTNAATIAQVGNLNTGLVLQVGTSNSLNESQSSP